VRAIGEKFPPAIAAKNVAAANEAYGGAMETAHA